MRVRPTSTRRSHFLLAPTPSVAAVIALLVASVLATASAPLPDVERAAAATASAAPALVQPPASVTRVTGPAPAQEPVPVTARVSQGPGPATGVASSAVLVSGSWSGPNELLAAYRRAVAGAPAGCHLPISLLAAIGQVESGSLAGRSVDAAHRAVPPVFGPMLNGGSYAAIPDTDGGRLDGSALWDRAVGPMQFIPSTWAGSGVDGDGDGRADPQNVYDAAASAAGYLCAGGRDLSLASGLQSAILSYNHSMPYLATVLAWQGRFSGVDLTPTGSASVSSLLTGRTPPIVSTALLTGRTRGPVRLPRSAKPAPVVLALPQLSPDASGTEPSPSTSTTTAPPSSPTPTSPTTSPTETTTPPSPPPATLVCPPGSIPSPTSSTEPTSTPTPTVTTVPPDPTPTTDPTPSDGTTVGPTPTVDPTPLPAGCVLLPPTVPPEVPGSCVPLPPGDLPIPGCTSTTTAPPATVP